MLPLPLPPAGAAARTAEPARLLPLRGAFCARQARAGGVGAAAHDCTRGTIVLQAETRAGGLLVHTVLLRSDLGEMLACGTAGTRKPFILERAMGSAAGAGSPRRVWQARSLATASASLRSTIGRPDNSLVPAVWGGCNSRTNLTPLSTLQRLGPLHRLYRHCGTSDPRAVVTFPRSRLPQLCSRLTPPATMLRGGAALAALALVCLLGSAAAGRALQQYDCTTAKQQCESASCKGGLRA